MEPVAAVFLIGPQAGKSISYGTLPGRHLDFRGGKGTVFDEREMPTLLRRADVEISPSARYIDFLPAWMNKCGECDIPKARLSLPEGLEIAGTPTQYYLRVKEPGDETDADGAEPLGWDVTEEAVCPICEQAFRRNPSLRGDIAPQKYCGRECREEGHRRQVAVNNEKKRQARLAAQVAVEG